MSESNTHSNPEPTVDASQDASQDAGQDAQMDPAAEPAAEATGDVLGGPASNTTEKDPSDWTTGDEPMTGAQRSYLDTLAREAGETLSPELTKAEASEHIDRLQAATGRGAGS